MSVLIQRSGVDAARDSFGLRESPGPLSATGLKIGVRFAADIAHRIEAA